MVILFRETAKVDQKNFLLIHFFFENVEASKPNRLALRGFGLRFEFLNQLQIFFAPFRG
jgi:hypothetical protein